MRSRGRARRRTPTPGVHLPYTTFTLQSRKSPQKQQPAPPLAAARPRSHPAFRRRACPAPCRQAAARLQPPAPLAPVLLFAPASPAPRKGPLVFAAALELTHPSEPCHRAPCCRHLDACTSARPRAAHVAARAGAQLCTLSALDPNPCPLPPILIALAHTPPPAKAAPPQPPARGLRQRARAVAAGGGRSRYRPPTCTLSTGRRAPLPR